MSWLNKIFGSKDTTGPTSSQNSKSFSDLMSEYRSASRVENPNPPNLLRILVAAADVAKNDADKLDVVLAINTVRKKYNI